MKLSRSLIKPDSFIASNGVSWFGGRLYKLKQAAIKLTLLYF